MADEDIRYDINNSDQHHQDHLQQHEHQQQPSYHEHEPQGSSQSQQMQDHNDGEIDLHLENAQDVVGNAEDGLQLDDVVNFINQQQQLQEEQEIKISSGNNQQEIMQVNSEPNLHNQNHVDHSSSHDHINLNVDVNNYSNLNGHLEHHHQQEQQQANQDIVKQEPNFQHDDQQQQLHEYQQHQYNYHQLETPMTDTHNYAQNSLDVTTNNQQQPQHSSFSQQHHQLQLNSNKSSPPSVAGTGTAPNSDDDNMMDFDSDDDDADSKSNHSNSNLSNSLYHSSGRGGRKSTNSNCGSVNGGGEGTSKGPNGDVIIKRCHHNVLERKRRDLIKESFTKLRDSVPSLASERASRAQILKKAADFIQCTHQRNENLRNSLDELTKKNKELALVKNVTTNCDEYVAVVRSKKEKNSSSHDKKNGGASTSSNSTKVTSTATTTTTTTMISRPNITMIPATIIKLENTKEELESTQNK